jgi:hypothetical protein
VNNRFEGHGEEEGDFLFGHAFVCLSLKFVGVHFGLQIFEGDGRVFVFEFLDGKFVFGVPHGVLLVGVFGLWVGFEHLLKFSGPVVGFSDAHTDKELDFDDDVVLFDVILECVLLDYLVVRSFGGFAELTRAIHPSPEVFGRGYDVIRDVIETFD